MRASIGQSTRENFIVDTNRTLISLNSPKVFRTCFPAMPIEQSPTNAVSYLVVTRAHRTASGVRWAVVCGAVYMGDVAHHAGWAYRSHRRRQIREESGNVVSQTTEGHHGCGTITHVQRIQVAAQAKANAIIRDVRGSRKPSLTDTMRPGRGVSSPLALRPASGWEGRSLQRPGLGLCGGAPMNG